MTIKVNVVGSRPLVSVIVPAFNAELTLRKTAQSALGGCYTSIELILVDDGSTDFTAALAHEIARSDPRVRIISRPNGGLSAALNSGFAVANGEFIARLDADDVWHPHKLERQVQLALRDPDLAFVYSWVRYVDGEGRLVRDGPAQSFPRHALCRGYYESLVGGGSSALMKRSAVAEAGGCDESLRSWEDLLLQLTICSRHPIGFVPAYLVAYRLRPDSLTADIPQMLDGWRVVRRRIEAQFPQVPRRVHGWAHGKRCAMFAESFAWRRQYRTCASLLAEAMRYDPVRTSYFLKYRIARRLARHDNPSAIHKPIINFADCDPDQPQRLEAYEPRLEGGDLGKLEAKRTAELAKLDTIIAATSYP